ncbi:MAG: sulfite exporter TauE/SafE family protein [Verrucomicrobiales bacterium]|nr:sulfite exporter TauE/SafE family protein [Verrucomicrobiae bacterium]MCP5553262.1 sulfite exporter TauE/SafE family protein [Akkermansiaceae bacterium]HRX54616.1 sulfite exporter TauE/SafE family protein [Verrucomicrobiales bacterium]
MPDQPTLLAVLCLALATYVQAATGFGFAIVAVATLPLLMSPHRAVEVMTVFNLLVTALTLWTHRRALQWRRILPLTLATFLSMPIGFFVVRHLDRVLLLRSLGVVLILISAMDFWLRRHRLLALPGWTAWPLGTLGGTLGGAFGTGGPPIVAFVYSQGWDKSASVGALQVVFIVMSLTRNVLMGATGDFNSDLVSTVAWAVPPGLFAVWLGKRTLDRVPQAHLRTVVFGAVFLLGIWYVMKPI